MDLRERNHDEQRHPWEIARSEFFCTLAQTLRISPGARVLDVGAGDGWLAGELLAELGVGSQVVCWDVNYSDADLASDTGSPSITRIRELEGHNFDLVLMLDVLEHVEDDAGVVDQIASRMRPGSPVLVSVPVHPALFTQHDKALAHVRRYRVREIQAVLRKNFDVEDEGSLFTTLLAPRAVQRALEVLGVKAKSTGVGTWSAGPRVTSLITSVLVCDGRINRRFSNRRFRPPGLSYWAVARLPIPAGD